MTKPDKNPLEWTVFGIGLVLVLTTLGYLVQESITTHPGPPDVVARLGATVPSANGYLVPVEVANVGKATAEDVLVPVFLDLADGKQEEAQLTIAYLPRDSRRDGWISFRNDPRQGTLRLGAIAFEVP